jgi:hypothetical protein
MTDVSVFKANGIIYEAKDDVSEFCDGCAFQYKVCGNSPDCEPDQREDKRNIIWARKKDE